MLARVIAVLALVMVWGGAHASAAWVDDSIYVPIRAAANPSGRILHRGIKSGTRIEFMGFEGDWAKIRYGDIDGYIGKQYLSQSPTAAIQLERARNESEQAKAEAAKLHRHAHPHTPTRTRFAYRTNVGLIAKTTRVVFPIAHTMLATRATVIVITMVVSNLQATRCNEY